MSVDRFDTGGERAGATSGYGRRARRSRRDYAAFIIWDSGDQNFDSTVLLDNFRWLTSAPVTVGTEPVAEPL